MVEERSCDAARTYVAMVWIGDEPARRVSVLAESLEDASDKLNTEFGSGNVFDLHNEDDAQRPR
jgi:hypothetical protein